MLSKIKVGDIVTDDLTRTKAKVIEVLEPGPNELLPGYRIDNDYLDGYRQAWEIWTDEQLKELQEEQAKEVIVDELWENELKEANQWLANILKSTSKERQDEIQNHVLAPSIKYGLYNEVVVFAYREYKAKASRMALPEFANLTEEEYQNVCFNYAMDEWDL